MPDVCWVYLRDGPCWHLIGHRCPDADDLYRQTMLCGSESPSERLGIVMYTEQPPATRHGSTFCGDCIETFRARLPGYMPGGFYGEPCFPSAR